MAGKCKKCGRDFSDGEAAPQDGNGGICSDCQGVSAAKTERIVADERPQRRFFSRENNTMGLVGFILSIISLLPLFNIASPVALAFSIAGLTKRPRGLAVAGSVVSGFVTAVNILAFCLVTFVAHGNTATRNDHAAPKYAPMHGQPPKKNASSRASMLRPISVAQRWNGNTEIR